MGPFDRSVSEKQSRNRGWVFLCSNTTEGECFERNLVGTKQRHLYRLRNLEPGDPILLYNYESRKLVGHFAALSKAQLDIVPDAWNRNFRAQVSVELQKRFKRPLSRDALETFPGLNFDVRGYLTNFSLPVEVILGILDVAAGRRKLAGDVVNPAEQSFRRKFPANLLGSDGHWVRSRGELLIDNWLYTQRPSIPHAYERRLPVSEEVYSDFYVPVADCYLEYWGIKTPEYRVRRKKKLEIYEKYSFNVISLEDRNIAELDDRLATRLLEYLPDAWRFR